MQQPYGLHKLQKIKCTVATTFDSHWKRIEICLDIEVVFLLLPEWRQYGIKKNRHHNSPDKKMVDAELSTPIRQKKSSLIKWNMKSLIFFMYIHIQDRSFTYIIMRTKKKKNLL
jgi:hypothetical protein